MSRNGRRQYLRSWRSFEEAGLAVDRRNAVDAALLDEICPIYVR